MTSIRSIRPMLISACLLFFFADSASVQDRSLDPSHRTLLSLVIGESASHDIYSKMGPVIPIRDNSHPSVIQLCYVSGRDDTLVIFYSEFSRCSRARLLSQKKRFQKWHFCSASPLVSEDVATASGIGLGMSKHSLIAILGPPDSEADQILNYSYEWQQKMNSAEIAGTSEDSTDPGKNPFRRVKATIQAEFSNTGLISFDLSQRLQ
jgi:hypothetical protein